MRCASKTGYAYHFELYLGKRKNTEELGIGEGVVLGLSEGLKNKFATLYFDNFFNSPTLIKRLYERGLYGIGTVRSNRKHMPEMLADKQMQRGDSQYHYCDSVLACKWMDNRGVLMVATAVDGFDMTSTVQRRGKGSVQRQRSIAQS